MASRAIAAGEGLVFYRQQQAGRLRRVRIVTGAAGECSGGKPQVSIGELGGLARVAIETSRGDRLIQEMCLGRSVRRVAVDTSFGLGSRKMCDLGLELLPYAGMTTRAQIPHGCAQKGSRGAGVRLMTGATVAGCRLVSGATRRRRGRYIMAVRADFGRTGSEQTGRLRSVRQMAGVAVSAGIGFVLRETIEGLDQPVVAFLAQSLSSRLQEASIATVRLVTRRALPPRHGVVKDGKPGPNPDFGVAVAAQLVLGCNQQTPSSGSVRVVAIDAFALRRFMNHGHGLLCGITVAADTELSFLGQQQSGDVCLVSSVAFGAGGQSGVRM